ncbi:MAG: hypothetical protein ACKKL5_03520 [Candidatus Komeilibacteria bacterium]
MYNKENPLAGNNYENKEVAEGLIEAALLYSRKVNEGNNGIINQLQLDQLAPEILNYFREASDGQINEQESVATKLLKVYSPEVGKTEAARQQQAYKIWEAAEDKSALAKVPRLLFYKEITIKNQELLERLSNDGVHAMDGKVAVLVMDFIEGEDLAMYLVKQIVAHHPELADLQQALQDGADISFAQLHSGMSAALGFATAGGQHRNLNDNIFEEQKVNNDNVKLMVEFMRRKGIIINSDILRKVKNTIDLFHANDFQHGDLHERNIMLQFDEAHNLADVFIIDYGQPPAELEEEGSKIKLNDYLLYARYWDLTLTPEEREASEHNKLWQKLDRLEKRLQGQADWITLADQLVDKEKKLTVVSLERLFKINIGKITMDQELYWDIVMVAWRKLLKTRPNLAYEHLGQVVASNLPIFIRNKVRQFWSALEKSKA